MAGIVGTIRTEYVVIGASPNQQDQYCHTDQQQIGNDLMQPEELEEEEDLDDGAKKKRDC